VADWGLSYYVAAVTVEVVSRARVDDGAFVDRLVCHPVLPLVAGQESGESWSTSFRRPAVHVWDCGGGQLRELGTVSADRGRSRWGFALSWEPGDSLLLAANYEITGTAGTVARWTPAGVAGLDGLPPTERYTYMEFSPDGRALWASPSAGDRGRGGSDIVDLASGAIAAGQRWDTGVAVHPGGGLAATLASEAGATCVIFARVGQGGAPAVLRWLGRTLILDHDGYMPPVFSPDGRYLAIRGNSYGHSLDAFEFPSLRHVLAADLDPRRADMSHEELADWFGAWPRHNIAFGARPGVLWAGTPAGALIETDLDSGQAATHHVLGGSPVSALSATAGGDLIVATSGGEVALVSVTAGHRTAPAPDAPQARAAAFLAGTSVVPDDRHFYEHLVVTDGDGHGSQWTWQPSPPPPNQTRPGGG
jgi:hypothetical protein